MPATEFSDGLTSEHACFLSWLYELRPVSIEMEESRVAYKTE